MAHFLCHLGCSHFGALLLDFYFTENRVKVTYDDVEIQSTKIVHAKHCR